MKIYTVSFEKIVKSYIPYVDSIKKLESEKMEHLTKINNYKSEMQSIIDSSQSLILDENSKKEKMEKFGRLQNEAGKLDNDFRIRLSKMQDDIMKKVYGEISTIISDFSSESSIDMVVNDTEVIYFSPKMDLTDSIIDIMKEKNLYVGEMEIEKES